MDKSYHDKKKKSSLVEKMVQNNKIIAKQLVNL